MGTLVFKTSCRPFSGAFLHIGEPGRIRTYTMSDPKSGASAVGLPALKIGGDGEIRTHILQVLDLTPLPRLGYTPITRGGIRTHTLQILNPTALPVGLHG